MHLLAFWLNSIGHDADEIAQQELISPGIGELLQAIAQELEEKADFP